MRQTASLSKALNATRAGSDSNLSHRLDEFGEQKLRSMLIEPVQRLPRYSLLLDNMIGQLPTSHPAISSLLKSKDTLADICALENGGSADSARTSSTLRKFIDRWPSWLAPRGRLIVAVDAIEIDPPYSNMSSGQHVVLLLFPDTLIIVRKKGSDAPSAKGIVAEVDRSAMTSVQDTFNDLSLLFCAAFDLSKLRLSESADGRTVRMTHVMGGTSYLQAFHSTSTNVPADVNVKVLLLLGPYEGKAHRLSEDIVKARIEGRFSEPIRESDKWALRTMDVKPGSPGLIAAIYEDSAISKIDAIKAPCWLRVNIGSQDDLGSLHFQKSVVEVAASVVPLGPDTFRLDVSGIEGSRCSEKSAIKNLGHVLVKNGEAFVACAPIPFINSQLWQSPIF